MATSKRKRESAEVRVDLLQALPREVFDLIYEMTFTRHSGLRHISADSKRPQRLQIDRKSRELFAKSWYGRDSIFVMNLEAAGPWLKSLPSRHFNMLTEIRLANEEFLVDLNSDYIELDKWNAIRSAVEVMNLCLEAYDLADRHPKIQFKWKICFRGKTKARWLTANELEAFEL